MEIQEDIYKCYNWTNLRPLEKNENIIKTDSMTSVEIQDAEQALYNQGKNVLTRISQPRYEINFDLPLRFLFRFAF
jgi:hypothetical protein